MGRGVWFLLGLATALPAAALTQATMPWSVESGAAERPIRSTLANVPLPEPKLVDRVEMMRVDYPARQVQQRHVHPVPLVCFVAIGRIGLKLEGRDEMVFEEGGVNVEPANVVVERVANLTDRPARQYCSFLAGRKDTVLSRYLDAGEKPAAE